MLAVDLPSQGCQLVPPQDVFAVLWIEVEEIMKYLRAALLPIVAAALFLSGIYLGATVRPTVVGVSASRQSPSLSRRPSAAVEALPGRCKVAAAVGRAAAALQVELPLKGLATCSADAARQ